MKPTEKNPELADGLDRLAFNFFGRTRTAAIHNNICTCCGQPAVDFRDELSRKDYAITGFCQNCQDLTYGDEDE